MDPRDTRENQSSKYQIFESSSISPSYGYRSRYGRSKTLAEICKIRTKCWSTQYEIRGIAANSGNKSKVFLFLLFALGEIVAQNLFSHFSVLVLRVVDNFYPFECVVVTTSWPRIRMENIVYCHTLFLFHIFFCVLNVCFPAKYVYFY